ncbi:MAG: Rieske 2Fe-2S domain-containing protein [Actinomycetota bacterium]|nr:Rieske 2Fe-2S domain-containing protein [Actinomycetota bacterium]
MTMVEPTRQPLISKDWRVSGAVYRDPEVFEREMSEIYGRTWVYVAHETELPAGGDYKTAHIGRQPVIVSRSADDGNINVMFNRCRHRGSRVCQREFGNANVFRCAYHGWTYNSSGSLIGLPFDDAYGPDFDKSVMGLAHVARVESYRGFIFASLDPDIVSLDEYLGHSKQYFDFIAEIGPEGPELTANAHKLVYRGNWKLQIENTIDPYHFSFTHQSWLDILKERTGKSSPWVKNVRTNPDWRGLALGNGHAVHEYGSLAQDRNTHEIAIGELLPFMMNVFPSLAFVGAHLRLIVPRAVDETWVYLYPILPKGADEATRTRILRDHELFYGSAGFGSTDDIEVGFDRVTDGLQASASPEDWHLMSRGLHREVVEEGTGITVGRSSDEVPQRGWYTQWLKQMGEAQ